MKSLGIELNIAGFCISPATLGQLAELTTPQLLKKLVSYIGMDTGGMKPDVREFPVNGGKGGVGSTTFQPLTESFAFGMQPSGALFVDSWTDHGHDFIVLASCKPIDFRAVGQWLVDQGYEILDSFIDRLESNPWKARVPDIKEKLLRACN